MKIPNPFDLSSDQWIATIITLFLITGIVCAITGVSTGLSRDRAFEDACRVAGGSVHSVPQLHTGDNASAKDACVVLLAPERDSVIPVKPYR